MTLHDFMKARGLSDAELAARLGVSRQTVYRCRRGLRMPDRETMLAIHRETDGAVTVESFYGLGPQAQPERAPGSAA